MVLCQGGEAAAVPAAGGKEPEVPLSREDCAGTGQPRLCPAPGMEAAVGAEERRVCGCCSVLSWPRCCKAPGEEGGVWQTGQGEQRPPGWATRSGGDIACGAEEEEAAPRAPGLTAGGGRARSGASSGGRRGRPAPVPAPPPAARGPQPPPA